MLPAVLGHPGVFGREDHRVRFVVTVVSGGIGQRHHAGHIVIESSVDEPGDPIGSRFGGKHQALLPRPGRPFAHPCEQVAAEAVVDEPRVPGGQFLLDPRLTLLVTDVVGPRRQAGRDRMRAVGDRPAEIGGEMQRHDRQGPVGHVVNRLG